MRYSYSPWCLGGGGGGFEGGNGFGEVGGGLCFEGCEFGDGGWWFVHCRFGVFGGGGGRWWYPGFGRMVCGGCGCWCGGGSVLLLGVVVDDGGFVVVLLLLYHKMCNFRFRLRRFGLFGCG